MRGDSDHLDAVEYDLDRPHFLLLSMDGVFRRMLKPSEAETVRRAGTAVDKMSGVPLMC